jgi:uncharacterized protein YndB with AHSA1/START domain
MRFHHEQWYDAPPERVYAMLTDPAFRERVCRVQQARDCTVSVVAAAGAGLTVTIDQTRPSEGIPGFARKIVGDEIQVVQHESWSGSTHAVLAVTIPGRPGELNGTVTLAASGTGTVQTVDGELKVSVPLLGAKLEELVSGLLAEALGTEQQTGRGWLAGER